MRPCRKALWLFHGLGPASNHRDGRSHRTRAMNLGVRGTTLGDALSSRHNSLNFLRLALAFVVVLAHGTGLGAYSSNEAAGEAANVAVYGFFAISGYLIAGSAVRNSVARYLWQRCLRILPGFWVCLLLTALVFGFIASVSTDPHCSYGCYLHQAPTPLHYFAENFFLKIRQSGIGTTLHGVPFPNVWNGSLGTLFYEFLCYLLIAVLAATALLRKRPFVVLVLALGIWLVETITTIFPVLNSHFDGFHNWDEFKLLTLVPVFLVGSVVFLYKDRLPDSSALAAVCALLFLGFAFLPLGGGTDGFNLTSFDIGAPFLVYPLLWLGIHLPLQSVGARNDYSYGVYIYAFPIAQLLALWKVDSWGYVPYVLLTLAMVAPLAAASWWTVERHALRLKTLGVSRPADVVPPAALGGDTPMHLHQHADELQT